MFGKHCVAIHILRRSLRVRSYSSTDVQSIYPFRSLRALPFALSPSDAITYMAPFASVACMFNGIIGSLGARFLPGFGFEPFKPARIRPVYFPAWIIDAEVQASVTMTEDEQTEKRDAAVHFVDSYLPGSDFNILSSLSYWTQQARKTSTVPFTEDLQTQFGTDVSCIPYNISPFSLLEAAHSLSYSDATLDDDIRFTPPSVKTSLFAAYPVLIPLYLAQYEFTIDKLFSVTVWMEAFSSRGRVFSERLGAEAGASLRDHLPNAPSAFINFTHALDGLDHIQQLTGSPAPAPNIPALMITGRVRRGAPILESWLEDHLRTPGAASKLAEMSPSVGVVQDDPRVREYTNEETAKTRNWMALGSELWTMNSMVDSMSRKGNPGVFVIGTSDPTQALDAVLHGLREQKANLEAKREEIKPDWWKEWEEKSGSSQS